MSIVRDDLGRFIKGHRSGIATEFKKGERRSIATEFKKGQVSRNKGLKFGPMSEERKRALSEKLKGRKKPLRSEEHKRKLSESCKGRPGVKSMLGKKHTEEWRVQASKRMKELMSDEQQVRKVLARREMSTLEERVQAVIDKYGLPYKFVGNGQFFIERKNPDFINITGERIAIEVFARKHKERLRNMSIEEWKAQRQEIFSRNGWQTIFIEDYQTNKEDHLINLLKG